MPRPTTRRQFLASSSLATTAVITAPNILRGRDLNNKLNLAIIGVSGAGGFKMNHLAQKENIVALCDVSEAALNGARTQHPNAKVYTDFRKLYEHANEFDAVVVSTCEHTHAFATLPALQLGKHVLCEKPLAYNIHETRVIREAAAKAKVATQMGIQIHAGDNYRRVVELVQSGAIGPVKEAHVWVGACLGIAIGRSCQTQRRYCICPRPTQGYATSSKGTRLGIVDRASTVSPLP
jgi:hypothetical protein